MSSPTTATTRERSGSPAPAAPPPDESKDAAVPHASSGPTRPPKDLSSPFLVVMDVFLKEKGNEATDDDEVVFLLPSKMPRSSVRAGEPVFMALTLAADQGFGAGMWSLFAVVDQDVRSFGPIESPNARSVRFFRTKQDTAVFRRFWFQIAEPTPQETHRGTYDDIELTAGGGRAPSKEAPIDLHSKQGLALWNMPRGVEYSCDVKSFRGTGRCKLKELAE